MGKRYYILIAALLIIFILVALSTSPTTVNWHPTYRKKDKNPYGAEVTYEFLEDIYGKKNISMSRTSPFTYMDGSMLSGTNVIYIADRIGTEEIDMEVILKFVMKGNNVFFAAHEFSGDLADTLGLNSFNKHGEFGTPKDVKLSFTNPGLSQKQYSFKSSEVENFITIDSTKGQDVIVLSESSDYEAHFVQVPMGMGNIFLHSNPMIFTNYDILHEDNQHDYISTCLSYMPEAPTLWSEFYSAGGSVDGGSDMRFILGNPQMKWAYFILIFGILTFLIFQTKRRQRAIPVVKPPKNSTLEFVETTGRLYFQQHNHADLARKKIKFFLEKIRTKFYLNTSVLDEAFIDALAMKSGVSQEEIRPLIKDFDFISKAAGITENQLVELNKKIETFYSKASV